MSRITGRPQIIDCAPDTSFQDAAGTTYELALARDGAARAHLVRVRFEERGITF